MGVVQIDKIAKDKERIEIFFNDNTVMYFNTVNDIQIFIAREKEDQVLKDALADILASDPNLDNPEVVSKWKYETVPSKRTLEVVEVIR